jgi:hypothetical protein
MAFERHWFELPPAHLIMSSEARPSTKPICVATHPCVPSKSNKDGLTNDRMYVCRSDQTHPHDFGCEETDAKRTSQTHSISEERCVRSQGRMKTGFSEHELHPGVQVNMSERNAVRRLQCGASPKSSNLFEPPLRDCLQIKGHVSFKNHRYLGHC